MDPAQRGVASDVLGGIRMPAAQRERYAGVTPPTSPVGAVQQSSLTASPPSPEEESIVESASTASQSLPVRPRSKPVAPCEEPTLTAISTQAGTLTLACGSEVLWEVSLGQQLFCLARLDATGDGLDELVACAWNGATFFCDAARNVVLYQFEEEVCAFTGGIYATAPGENVATLVYLTFSGRLCLYHHVRLGGLGVTQLSHVMADTAVGRADQVDTMRGMVRPDVGGHQATLAPAAPGRPSPSTAKLSGGNGLAMMTRKEIAIGCAMLLYGSVQKGHTDLAQR